MCGIFGVIGEKIDDSQRVLFSRSLDKMYHRGPDDFGIWSDEGDGVSLGHRRLSILDLSINGRQPMESKDGRYQIVFNGEIYNFVELRSDLEKNGDKFRTDTDTEVLLALFSKYKEDMLSFLDGMFAIAIWDTLEKKLFLARDRFGEKPLYYTQTGSRLIFASEIKAIVHYLGQAKVDEERLAAYLMYGSIKQPNQPSSTYYQGIKEFLPSNFGYFKEGQLSSVTYYQPKSDRDQLQGRLDFEEFREILKTSVKRRLRADVPVGSSLSGGLDSSTIVSLINELKTGREGQFTFSARFEDFEKDEGEFIHSVLEGKPIEGFEVFPKAGELLTDLDSLHYHQEEVCGSASVFAQWKVMSLAKEQEVTVLLDGQGADEYLGGYHSYYPDYFRKLKGESTEVYQSELRAYKDLFGKPFKYSIYDKLLNINPKLYNSFRDIYASIITPKYLAADFIKSNKHIPHPNIKKGIDFRGRLLYQLTGSGLNNLLRYSDKNSMAFSREVRLPFLSHELVDYSLDLPVNGLITKCWTKYILRKAMEASLPANIVWRKDKIGYEPPQKRWLEHSDFLVVKEEAVTYLNNMGVLDKKNGGEVGAWKAIQAFYLYRNINAFVG